MSALLDRIPFVPKLTKFLVCLDLYQSVRITTIRESLKSLIFQFYPCCSSLGCTLDYLRHFCVGKACHRSVVLRWQERWLHIDLIFRLCNLEFDLVCRHRRSLRFGGLGHAEEQQALSSPSPLHDPHQHHHRCYQRHHLLCLAGNFQVFLEKPRNLKLILLLTILALSGFCSSSWWPPTITVLWSLSTTIWVLLGRVPLLRISKPLSRSFQEEERKKDRQTRQYNQY